MAMTVTGLDAIVGSHSHTNPATGFGAYKYLPSIVADPNDKPVVISQAYRYNNTLGEIVLGMRAKAGGGYEVVSKTGRYLSVVTATAEDAATKAIIDPYVAALAAYNNTVVGQTTAPIDALAGLHPGDERRQPPGRRLGLRAADEERHPGRLPPVRRDDQPRSRRAATPASRSPSRCPTCSRSMPYENSLVVLSMNGPQLKAVLERAYRNYYYYKYVPGYGGYSYYTTCMLDINAGGKITYNDVYPTLPERQQRRLARSSAATRSTSPTPRRTTRSRRSTTWPPAPATSTTAA